MKPLRGPLTKYAVDIILRAAGMEPWTIANRGGWLIHDLHSAWPVEIRVTGRPEPIVAALAEAGYAARVMAPGPVAIVRAGPRLPATPRRTTPP